MTEEQMEKCAWTNGYLNAALRTANLDINRVRYRVDGPEEFVDVMFDNRYVKTACVTGDSMKAIMADVLKIV